MFDTSAVLAIIFEEPGAEIAARYLEGAVMSSVNWAEMGVKASDRGLDATIFLEQAGDLGIRCAAFDRDQAELAAAMRLTTRRLGLSLADRACLALAKTLDRRVITADRAWRDTDIGVTMEFIR